MTADKNKQDCKYIYDNINELINDRHFDKLMAIDMEQL